MARTNPRAAQQRAVAKAVRENRRILPTSLTASAHRGTEAYVKRVQSGQEPEPPKGSLEAKNLARWASRSRWHKADPSYLDSFRKYFYKDEKKTDEDEEEEEEE